MRILVTLRRACLTSALALACVPVAAQAATPGAPDVQTLGIESITSTSIEVQASINPLGSETRYRVDYDVESSPWCQASGAAGTPANQTASEILGAADNAYHVLSVGLTGLTSGTAYCARVTATNEAGSGFGSMLQFTVGAPGVLALSGHSSGATSAIVGGSVNPVGRATEYWARYAPMSSEWCQTEGSSGSALDVTTPQSLPQTDNIAHGVTVTLTGLAPASEYCAQLVARNDMGTGAGGFVSITTDVAPAQLCGVMWNGGAGNWTDANWTFEAPATDAGGDGVPDADDDVCMADGTVTMSGAQTVAALRVTGTARLDISGDLTLDAPGTATANDGAATVASDATIQLTSTSGTGGSLVGGTLTNGGTIRTLAGAGGARTLSFASIANGGGATLESNTATSIGAFAFTNSGTITSNGGLATNQHATLSTGGHELNQNAGTIDGSGTLLLQNGTYHHNGGAVSGTVLSAAAESLDLDGAGTANVSAIGGTSYLAGDVGADKTLIVRGGFFGQPATLSLTGSRTNVGTIVLSNSASGDGGAATLDLGAHTLNNGGTLRSAAIGADAGTRVVEGTGTLANGPAGMLDLDHATAVRSRLTSAGAVDVADSAVATVSNHDFVQTAGITTLEGDLELPSGKLDLQGGTLAGDGQLIGPLENGGGIVSPGGGAPAKLSVSGNYSQGQNGTLRIDTDDSGHDRLAVGGSAALGGNLVVDGASSTPDRGDEFMFVSSDGALAGTFASESGMSASGGVGYETAYHAGPPGSAKLIVVAQHTLSVTTTGSGSGKVTSNPPGVDCGTDCTHVVSEGRVVTLTAAPAGDARFGGWSGTGTETCSGDTCAVTMSQARSVTATFVRQRTLTVAKAGSGDGTAVSDMGGIDCGSACTEDYDEGAVVTLSAGAAPGSRFAGWSGEGCTGTGPCQVTMNAARNVTATFIRRHTLSVVNAGSGSGNVSGAGIDCGSDCDETYDQGTVVTLTATAAAGSRFTGWSGDGCTGTGPCQVTMNAAHSVTANFADQRGLVVARTGSGSGGVTGPGIACGTDCEETYDLGSVVTLTAAPSPGSRLGGWTGAGTENCSGTTCQVTMSEARTVTVAFIQLRALSVTKTGGGSGQITGNGVNCGTDCFESHDQGTVVTLTAAPAAGSRFAGWSGDCSGTGTCQLTMSRARNVTAVFLEIEDGDRDGVSPPEDCNDGDARVKPGAADTPGNGVDEDCSGADAQNPPPPPAPPAGNDPPAPVDPGPRDPAPAPFGSDDGNNSITGTEAGETICGLLGNDLVNALGGDDTVYGDLCDVKAKTVAAQTGSGGLDAGGIDTLNGGAGNDSVYGAGGGDKLLGGDGNDKLYGGGGNDTLDGGAGRDTLDGGAGDDKLSGGKDANTIKAGAGDDSVKATNGKRDTIDCGAGKKDSATVDKADRVKGCEKVKRAKK